jgi:hypothetical protein
MILYQDGTLKGQTSLAGSGTATTLTFTVTKDTATRSMQIYKLTGFVENL